MRSPNISRLSGGAVTKLKAKDKTKFIILLILFLLVAVGVGCGIYYLMDVVFNGSVLDWLTYNYFFTEAQYNYATGEVSYLYRPNWSKLKGLLLTLFFVLLIFYALSLYLVAHFHARKKVRKSISKTSSMLYTYMHHDIDSADVFPPSYAEVATQIVQIKSTMQRHEQAVKTETDRKNDLITYLAHDLKTPLTSVIGYLDLSFMLMQLTDEFYPLLTSHGNTIELQTEEGLTVFGDSMKLARVFNNILKNAISYSYPNSPIKVWAGKREKDIIICFMNQGKTIPAEKLNAIFEKFYRMDEARSTNTGGAGLGLAIAKEIVTLHGGTIGASSENENTTFTVTLPIY